jgi:hypothetical protein
MVNEHEIRDHIAEYIAREISLASFERWLNSVNPRYVDPRDAAFRLLAAANRLVSERHDEVVSADELRAELSALLNRIVVSQPVQVTPEEQLYFSYLKMAAIVAKGIQASDLVAA